MLKRLFTAAFFLGLMNAGFGQEAKPAAPPTTTPQESRPTTPQESRPATPQTGNPQQAPNQQVPAGDPPVSRQMLEYYNKAKAAGLSDSDIERAALERGYTREQIDKIKSRLLNKEEESSTPDANRENDDPKRKQGDEGDVEEEEDQVDSLFTGMSVRAKKRMPLFGASFFSRFSHSFEPNLRIATPKNYVLGPEDEVNVDIYGNSVDLLKLKISPEGTVKMYNLAPVYIAGMTVEEATNRLIARLREAYSRLNYPGSGTYVSVTLGNIRSMRVMIAGEVVKPGTYTVSSLATAFNALYASGGPNANGSFRNIEVIRNNKVVKKIDLYRFLVNGDLTDNIGLQDEDIIMVKPYLSHVWVSGEVKRPGIYETKEGETFKDLLNYAGGLTPTAFVQTINFRRNTGITYEIGSFSEEEIATFLPQNGDFITVPKIIESVNNFVSLDGAVIRPGIYPLDNKNSTVKALIEAGLGIRPDAFLGRANLFRISGIESKLISFDLGKLLKGEVPDIPLELGDRVFIRSSRELQQASTVNIDGAVGNPGNFMFFHDMTIPDLIYNAGGFTQAGIPYRIEVSRRVKEDTTGIPTSQNVRIFTIAVNESLEFSDADKAFILEPFDRVYVRRSPRYEAQKTVKVTGEVVYPGSYTIMNNFERISDLIPKAGGLKPAAFLDGAQLLRNGELIALDIATILKKPDIPANVLLRDGDELVIPIRSDVVRIRGSVQNPSLINYEPGFRYDDYLAQAGGYLDNARKSRVYISYPNGRTKRVSKNVKILPGSTITVPAKDPAEEEKMSRSERIAILSLLVTATIAIVRLL